MNDLGKFLKELRGKRSLREIANHTGLSHTYIADIENGFRRGSKKPLKPSPETLKKLSEALDASYVEMMVMAGYWDEEELLTPINYEVEGKETHQIAKENSPSYANEREFVGKIDLSDDDLLQQFKLAVDGRELSEQETKNIIAFVRTLRQNS